MLASRQRQQRRLLNMFDFGAHALRLVIAAALALAVFALLLLADATGATPGLLSPLHALQVQSERGDPNTPTPTTGASATPTNTVAALPPTITLVSPSSAQGPVGAHVTIQGTNFPGGNPSIFASVQADCSQTSGTLPVTANVSGGSFTATFVWPATITVGNYYICTAGMTNSTAVYQVLSSSPPALSLSTLSAQIGQPLTIQGTNFVGLPTGAMVSLTESGSQTGGGQPPVTLQLNPVVDNNGSFSVTWTVQGPTTGLVTIRAFADSESGHPAVLQASATVTVQAAATATATAAISPTAQATIAGGGGVAPPTSNGSILLIVVLIVGIIIAIAVIVGIVFYLTMRRRGPQAGQGKTPGYNGYGGYGGYGETTIQSSSQYPLGAQDGGFSGSGQFGWPQAEGQVSQWEDTNSQPGPDWQPRPMSGYYPSYNDPTPNPRGPFPSGQRSRPESPVDPWDDPPLPPAPRGSYPQGNPGYRGEPAPPNPDDDQWPDLDNNGYSGGSRGW
jgi:hypothetical protein